MTVVFLFLNCHACIARFNAHNWHGLHCIQWGCLCLLCKPSEFTDICLPSQMICSLVQKHMIETKNVNSLTPDGCLLIYSISFIYSNIILWTTILYVTCWCIIFYVFWLNMKFWQTFLTTFILVCRYAVLIQITLYPSIFYHSLCTSISYNVSYLHWYVASAPQKSIFISHLLTRCIFEE